MTEAAVIFGNLQEIYDTHSGFRKNLEPIVAEWTHNSEVGPLFKEMVSVMVPQSIGNFFVLLQLVSRFNGRKWTAYHRVK